MRTAIFGGSFNPIHTGHAIMSNYLSQSGIVDDVWLMPGRINPLKCDNPPVSFQDRLAMCRLVADDCSNVHVTDVESQLPEPSYTWNTLRHLSQNFPDRKFVLFIGSDNWLCFDRWRNSEQILRGYELLIYPRPGYDVDASRLPEGVTLLNEAPVAMISSSFIRDGLASGANMNFFLPAKVLAYINDHNLYG